MSGRRRRGRDRRRGGRRACARAAASARCWQASPHRRWPLHWPGASAASQARALGSAAPPRR